MAAVVFAMKQCSSCIGEWEEQVTIIQTQHTLPFENEIVYTILESLEGCTPKCDNSYLWEVDYQTICIFIFFIPVF